MNQNISKKSFSIKNVFLSVFSCFAILCILTLLSAFFLKSISRHERFYESISWMISVLLSAWIAWISRRSSGNSVLFSALVSTLFSLFSIAIGCFFAAKKFDIVSLLLQYIFLVLCSIAVTVLLNYFSVKKAKSVKLRKPNITKR